MKTLRYQICQDLVKESQGFLGRITDLYDLYLDPAPFNHKPKDTDLVVEYIGNLKHLNTTVRKT